MGFHTLEHFITMVAMGPAEPVNFQPSAGFLLRH